MDKPRPDDEASDAVRLAMAVSRLRSRIRIEAGLRSTGIPISQLAVLGRIIDEGPTTAAALAASEHVTQQAIAQSLATLKQRGLVQKQADPSDGRKSLVTARGMAHPGHRRGSQARGAPPAQRGDRAA
jgi:DNA-binding MarR family transcriptional regulator